LLQPGKRNITNKIIISKRTFRLSGWNCIWSHARALCKAFFETGLAVADRRVLSAVSVARFGPIQFQFPRYSVFQDRWLWGLVVLGPFYAYGAITICFSLISLVLILPSRFQNGLDTSIFYAEVAGRLAADWCNPNATLADRNHRL
jgi:hypothetical protein